MNPKIINVILIIVGLIFIITSALSLQGILDYVVLLLGIILIILGIVGFRGGKVF